MTTATARAAPTTSLLGVAEAALVAVAVSTTIGFNRLFADASFLPSLCWFVAGSHALALVCRRAGMGIAASAAFSVLGVVLVTGWVLYPDTTWWGVPNLSTFDAARSDLSGVWALFQEVKAPAPVDPGFLLIAALALWLSAFVADWAAFRLWVPFEAIVPTATLFVFCAMLGAPRHRGSATLIYLVSVLGFLLAHRVARQQVSGSWLENDVRRGSNALLRSGAGLATIAVLFGVVGGPMLPGAGSEALVGWRDFDPGGESRQTVSPLVEIRSRLVDQSDTEVFSVTSSHRAYWRLTALDTFDGSVWSTKGSYRAADGELPDTGEFSAPATEVTQQFRILGLASIWLPAAYEPRAIETDEVEARWEAESGTLIVGREEETSDGMEYQVVSVVPEPDAALLSSGPATGPPPGDLVERYTDLDSGVVSDRVRQLATEITAEASTPYERALALQNYFRDNFTYSLEVDSGHSGDAIERFLDAQIGYCEQFAGTFAAMGRAVGLPTRVAVGFTPGDPDPVDAGVYHVRGKHAHAWPEVYLAGVGWLAFEPTPNRGAPRAQQYTGVPEQQVDSGNPGSATTLVPAPSPGATLPEVDPSGTTSIFDPTPDDVGGTGDRPPRPNPFVSFWRRWGTTVLWVLAVGAALVALYVVAVPAAHALRRHRRRARAEAPDDRVRVAWAESVEAMAVLGVEPRASETIAEFAARAERQLDGGAYSALATTAEAAEYAADGVDEETAAEAVTLSAGIQVEVRGLASRERRVRAALSPRHLLPRRAPQARVSEAVQSAEGRRDRVRAGV